MKYSNSRLLEKLLRRKSVYRPSVIVSTALLTVMLAACGGGGGGGNGGGGSGGLDRTVLTEPSSGLAPILFQDPGCAGGDESDLDGDGLSDCDERQLHGTNPALADTDGDSITDAAEVVVFDPVNSRVQFNPLVADIARIAIDLVSVPQIELDFTESNGNTRSVSTQHDQSTSEGVSTNRGGESSRQLEIGHTLSVSATRTVGTEVSVSPTDVGGSVSLETSLTVGLEASRSSTRGSSVNWSSEQRSENSRTFSESESVSNMNGVNFNGGTLRVSAQLRNFGRLAYDVENLFLSAVIFDPARPFQRIPVTNLSFANGSFPTTSVPNGSTSAPLVFTGDLSLSQARRLLNDSSNLVIEPSTFRLLDADNASILLREESLAAQTATVMIDFGANSNRVESHRIAVNRGFMDRSISALDAMTEVLGLNIEEGVGQWVYGNESGARATAMGLLSVEGVGQSSTQNRYWYGALNQNSGNTAGTRVTTILNLLDSSYNLNDIRLRAGDTLSFVYVGDADRDAIPDRYEDSFGTDPNNPDTDGDNLLDAIEVYGYMSNLSGTGTCDTGTQMRVTSNPLLMDSDEDGIDDATERADCTNPNFQVSANAGSDQFVAVNTPVTLNGSARGMFTSQPDYQWDLVSGPDVLVDGNPVRMLNGISPQFTAPEEVSTLVFDLSVMVDGGMSTDRVLVQVQENPSTAVYVGGPENLQGNGSINSPFPTLAEALVGLSEGEDLYIQTRLQSGVVVPYRVTNTVSLPPGTNLYGGYDASWQRDVISNRTPIELTPNTDFQPVVLIDANSSNATVSGLALRSVASDDTTGISLVALQVASGNRVNIRNNTLQTDDATGTSGASTYGSHIANVSRLQFEGNQILAGNAGRGADGQRGRTGGTGNDGSNANGASRGRGGLGLPGENGGNGGTGGAGTTNRNLSSGANGDGPGGDGGSSGNGGSPGDPGGSGSRGSAGAQSADTAGTGVRFAPTIGGTGRNGTLGGGGGGGGGGRNGGTQRGGGGGGGGESGDHGDGGTGAQGGGAAIGIWLMAIDAAELRNNSISAGNGGAGGDGGRGGSGGAGGQGGSGAAGAEFCIIACDRGSSGGSGGRGGRGGDGGDGAGGAGGPSIGLYSSGIAPIAISNSITTGMGGEGGSRGNAGNGGDSIAVFDAQPDDGLQPDVRSLQANVGTGGSGGNPSDDGEAGSSGCSGDSNCR